VSEEGADYAKSGYRKSNDERDQRLLVGRKIKDCPEKLGK